MLSAEPTSLPTVISSDSIVLLRSIIISGNRRTREKIMLRELTLKKGDWVHVNHFDSLEKRCQNQLINLSLFDIIDVRIVTDTVGFADMYISVIERWYTWPLPIFQLADRNFNQWWISKDLRRINYGVEFTQYNVRGHNETLKIKLQEGFTRKAEARYIFPWIDRKQRFGLAIKAAFMENKEVWYKTENNKLKFFRDEDDFMMVRWQSEIICSFRPIFLQTHSLSIQYNDVSIGDTITTPELNYNYLLNGRTKQQAFTLTYSFVFDKRDNKHFPLHGRYTFLQASHNGLGLTKDINLLMFNITHNRYFELKKRHYLVTGFKSKITFPQRQAYYNYRALGYNDFVRGYEYYVVDGQHSYLFKTNYYYRLFGDEIGFPFVPIRRLHHIPLSVFFSAYADAGYVVDKSYSQGNSFTNSWLYGVGLGLNFLAYYDRILRTEVSMNREGRIGLYLHLFYPL